MPKSAGLETGVACADMIEVSNLREKSQRSSVAQHKKFLDTPVVWTVRGAMTTVSTPKLRAHPAYLAVIRTIDKFTVVTSYLFVIAIVPLIFANVVEVFARYVLRAPTVWALDVTTMSYATLFMLGAALALLKGAHVRTDMLWERFSDRTKGMIDSLALLVFFLPTMAVLFFISWDDFLYSISIDERSSSGAWTPILWPLRGVIPLAAFMLFLQGISELMKSLWAWRTGEFLTVHEKIEI